MIPSPLNIYTLIKCSLGFFNFSRKPLIFLTGIKSLLSGLKNKNLNFPTLNLSSFNDVLNPPSFL